MHPALARVAGLSDLFRSLVDGAAGLLTGGDGGAGCGAAQ
jgi:hypothetical protein